MKEHKISPMDLVNNCQNFEASQVQYDWKKQVAHCDECKYGTSNTYRTGTASFPDWQSNQD